MKLRNLTAVLFLVAAVICGSVSAQQSVIYVDLSNLENLPKVTVTNPSARIINWTAYPTAKRYAIRFNNDDTTIRKSSGLSFDVGGTGGYPTGDVVVQIAPFLLEQRNGVGLGPWSDPITLADAPADQFISLSEGDSATDWTQYAGDTATTPSVVNSTELGSECVQLSGEADLGTGWRIPTTTAETKFDIRFTATKNFEMYFYTQTVETATDNKARFIVAQADSRTIASGSGFISETYGSSFYDGTAQVISLDVANVLTANGQTFVQMQEINIRGEDICVDYVRSGTSTPITEGAPTITINAIAGDDIIDSTEDDSDVIITGTTSSVEDGQIVTVAIGGNDLTGPVTSNSWSVTLLAADAQALTEDVDLTASVQTVGGVDVVAISSISHETAVVTEANGMANFCDDGRLDTRGVKAFPCADGGAVDAKGGRGGDLFIVDSMECSEVAGDGKHTLLEAVKGTGDSPGAVGGNGKTNPTYVVSRISGLMRCSPTLIVDFKSNLTIDGLTAPVPGIGVAWGRGEIKADSEIIIRGMRWLSYDVNGDNHSALRSTGSGSTTNLMLNRSEFKHAPDDTTVAFVTGSDSVGSVKQKLTMSDSIVAENDAHSTHSESRKGLPNWTHSMGPGCSQSFKGENRILDCWFNRNLIADNARRNPKFWRSSGGVFNNYIWNPHSAGIMVENSSTWAPQMDAYIEDNIIVHGPHSTADFDRFAKGIGIYVAGNDNIRSQNNVYREWPAGNEVDFPVRNDNPTNERMVYGPPKVWNAADFDCVGLPLTHRDADTVRIVDNALNRDANAEPGIGDKFNDQFLNDGDHGRYWLTSEGGSDTYYAENVHPGGYDTDNDGMEDAWETTNGLNVGTQDHNDDIDGDGYTNIEEFTAFMARC